MVVVVRGPCDMDALCRSWLYFFRRQASWLGEGQHQEEGRLMSGETGEEGGLCYGHGAGQPDNCGQSTPQHQLHTSTLMHSFCFAPSLSVFLFIFNAWLLSGVCGYRWTLWNLFIFPDPAEFSSDLERIWFHAIYRFNSSLGPRTGWSTYHHSTNVHPSVYADPAL